MTLTAVFSEILRMSLTAAAVILCILPVRLLLRRAPAVWRYALWAVVLFRLLCPVTVTADFAVLPSDLHTGAVVHEWRGEIPSARPVPAAPPPAEAPADPSALPMTAPSAAPSAADPLSVFSTIWLVGVLSMLTHSAISLARLRRSLADAVHLRGSIFCSRRTGTPFVLGVLRPKIYLPAVLSPAEQEYIVLHEQFHIRNGDHILRLLAFFALCLHWFDPLVWLAFALSGRDMEMRCDEAVLGRLGADIRADYSQSLLSLATGRRLPAGTPLAFGAGDTKRRIRNVLRWRTPSRRVTRCALALCLLVTAACAVDPKEPTDSPFGHAYAVEDAPYENGMFGGGYYTGSTETCYRISPDGSLLILYSGEDSWLPVGTFTETTLTKSNFDDFINDPIAAEIRQNCQKAWRLNANRADSDFYYLLEQTDGTILLGYGYNSDEIRLIRWVRQLRETADFPTDLYGAYVPNGCLYMNPLSSTLAVGGDDGSRYVISDTGFAIDDRRGGATVLDPIDWGWQDFPWTAEEWNALFWDCAALDLTQYRELLYQPLSDELCLLRADGDLWLVTLRENDAMGRFVWSIFRLVPEESTGYALWSYRREMNAPPPQFRFRFDLPYDEISAFCSGGQLQNGDVSGALLTYVPGEDLWWSPLDENDAQADSAVISFTLQSGDAPTAGGTLYIERWGDSTRHPAYQARVVGAGLTLANADDGTAVIRAN